MFCIQFGVCVSVIVVVSWVGKFLDVIEMYVKWKFSSLFLARSLFQSWCWLSDPFCRLIPTSHNQIIFQIQSPWVLIFRDISQTLRDSGAHPAKVLEKLTFVYDFLNEPISDRRRSILSTKSQLTGKINNRSLMGKNVFVRLGIKFLNFIEKIWQFMSKSD